MPIMKYDYNVGLEKATLFIKHTKYTNLHVKSSFSLHFRVKRRVSEISAIYHEFATSMGVVSQLQIVLAWTEDDTCIVLYISGEKKLFKVFSKV